MATGHGNQPFAGPAPGRGGNQGRPVSKSRAARDDTVAVMISRKQERSLDDSLTREDIVGLQSPNGWLSDVTIDC